MAMAQEMSAGPRISAQALAHRYGDRQVFRNLSLQLGPGDVAVVEGPNGSGKSTLLKIVAGLIKPAGGSIEACPWPGGATPEGIGYLSPELALYPELTGVENLAFFARVKGLLPTRALLRESLDQVGLLGRGSDAAGSYSSGMRQRLKLAFALLGRPPILILDEPTSNLDVTGAELVHSILETQTTAAFGGLAVIATNQLEELSWGSVRLSMDRLE